MPADFQSTARALSLPISEPDEQESPSFSALRPPWSHSSRRGSRSLSSAQAISFRDRTINQARSLYRAWEERWQRMTLVQKILYILASLGLGALGVASVFLAGKIFIWLGPKAAEWEHAPLAYVIIWFSIMVVSFPPLIGWTTLGTISGFLFGFWKGYVQFSSSRPTGPLKSLF